MRRSANSYADPTEGGPPNIVFIESIVPLLSSTERIGTVLSGKYRITCVLAHGGMGVVFSAICLQDGSEVALKLPRSELSGDETRALRLAAEGRVASRLNHPHVVTVLDSGLSEDGLPFVVFERLRGRNLHGELKANGRISPEQALAYLLPIAGALVATHDAGLVHRDIKPDNIYLHRGANGAIVPKLLDFGLAKAADATSLTRTGTAMGTPAYMAPEQTAGVRKLTVAADIWSLSAVLWRCLHGQPPTSDSMARGGDEPSLLSSPHSHLNQVLDQLPTLCRAVLRGLRPDPADRYPNIRAWVEATARAALTDHVTLPQAPDPVALPWWNGWLQTQTEDETASQDSGRPAPGRPGVETGALAPSRGHAPGVAWLGAALVGLAALALNLRPDAPAANPNMTTTIRRAALNGTARKQTPKPAAERESLEPPGPENRPLGNPEEVREATFEEAPLDLAEPSLARRVHVRRSGTGPAARPPASRVRRPVVTMPGDAGGAEPNEPTPPPFDIRPDFSASPQFKTTW